MLTLARQPSGSGSGGNGNVIYDDVIIRQQKYELRLILNLLQDYKQFLLNTSSYTKHKIFHPYDLVNFWLH